MQNRAAMSPRGAHFGRLGRIRGQGPGRECLLGALILTAIAIPAGGVAAESGRRGFAAPSMDVPSITQIVGRRNLPVALVGGAVAWVAFQRENPEKMASALDGGAIDLPGDIGNTYGNGLVLGAGALGLWAGGRIAQDARLSSAGADVSKAVIVSGLCAQTLKVATRRSRPDGAPHSFPSGHTAVAFAVAPVLADDFGWRVGVPAYALAALTAVGRMEDRRHYLSDVIVGATLGILVGRSIAGDREEGSFPGRLSVGRDGIGLTVDF